MCTAITLHPAQGDNFFGRNMDFSYEIDPQLYAVPRNYIWGNMPGTYNFRNQYSFMAIGQQSGDILSFFDGVNEKGFAAAALYFAGYAKYSTYTQTIGTKVISSLDFLSYLLGTCSSVYDLKALIKNILIVGLPDPVTKSIAPLHWIVTDPTGECVVIEQTDSGLQIFQNAIGVMTNSPDFQWHMTNLRNYIGISQRQENEVHWGNITLEPFGQAGGTTELPGGYTSPERFVRTSYLKTHTLIPNDRTGALTTCFHILAGSAIPKGVVITNRNTYDYTKYTAFINTATCEYFIKTYDNIQIRTARLLEKHKNAIQPLCLGSINGPIFFERLQGM